MKYVSHLMAVCLMFSFAHSQDSDSMNEKIKITWERKADMPEARRNLKAVVLNNELYALGGNPEPNTGRVKTNSVYDISNNVWTRRCDMITARTNFAVSTYDNKIYVAGGDPFLDKAEFYDPTTDKWFELPAMPTARQHVFGDISEGKFHIIGGLLDWEHKDERSLTTKYEIYDIKKSSWESLVPLPVKKQNPGISIIGEKIYVVGGMYVKSRLNTVHEFDLSTKKWEKKADIPLTGFYSGTVVVSGKIFLLDGCKKGENITRIFVYDPAEDKWESGTPLPVGIKLAGFASLGSKLYVVGGCDESFKAKTYLYEGTVSLE